MSLNTPELRKHAFRVLLASYLLVHFIELLPWGPELFSNQGAIPKADFSPIAFLFPNLLAVWDSGFAVTMLLVASVILSICLMIGCQDRIAAVLLWYLWACLFGRNPLISNPALPYVGWLLLAHACVSRTQQDSISAPHSIHYAAWIVLAVAYSYSGYTKLVSPSWVDGSAFLHVMNSSLARPTWIREFVIHLPAPILRAVTWSVLGCELLFAPLSLVRKLRILLWIFFLFVHFGLLALIDFSDLSAGMILFHLFTFPVVSKDVPGDIRLSPAIDSKSEGKLLLHSSKLLGY